MSLLLALTLSCAPQLPELGAVDFSSLASGERPVLFDEPGDGRTWALGANWKASFGPDGVLYVPLTRSKEVAPRPVRFRLNGATVDGRPVDATAPTAVTRSGDSVTLERGDVAEVWHLAPDRAEQTFVFDSLPTRGDVVLSVEVESELPRRTRGSELHFEGAFGAVRYGRAIALDAEGRRIDVERTPTATGFELRVDAAFVQDAALPLVVDPIISNTFTVATATRPQSRPDAVFGTANIGSGNTSTYFVAWEELAGGNDVDIVSVEVNENGTPVPNSLRVVDATTFICQRPRVAFHKPEQRWLVVYERSVTGGAPFHVHNRNRRMGAGQGFFFGGVASGVGAGDCRRPDVGGFDVHPATGTHNYTIVWEENGAGNWNVNGRQIRPTGGNAGDVIAIASGPEDERAPGISRGAGVPFFGFHWHNVVWTSGNPGAVPDVMARRIVTTGSAMTGQLQVSFGIGGRYPVATETLSGPVHPDGSLPFVAIYEAELNNSVLKYERQVGNGQVRGGSNLDNHEGHEVRKAPLAFSTKNQQYGAAYAYTTQGPSGVELRVSSGNLSYRAANNNSGLGLGERSVLAGTNLDDANGFTFASYAEGGSTQDRGALFWTEGGVLKGVLHEGPGSLLQPVLGTQYCTATANSTGERGWIAAFGSKDAIAPKSVVATDLPANAFGYLLVGPEFGSVSPAGSVGTLCLGGHVGRYVDQLQSSGAAGEMSFFVRPYDLPSPNGPVAAQAGENWMFQVWHRDTVGGQATSTFTNALQITFE